MKRMSDEVYNHLVRMKFGVAPRWCANAVATDAGWTNPRTGEVLMAFRGLATRINEFNAEKARREKLKEEESTKVEVKTKKAEKEVVKKEPEVVAETPVEVPAAVEVAETTKEDVKEEKPKSSEKPAKKKTAKKSSKTKTE